MPDVRDALERIATQVAPEPDGFRRVQTRRKRVERIVRADLFELLDRSLPFSLILRYSAAKVMKVICVEKIGGRNSCFVENGCGAGQIVVSD